MTPVEATFIIGGVAALIALWGVISQRQIASRRAMLDYIATSKSNSQLVEARRKFIELAKTAGAGGLAPWAAEAKEKTPEAQNISEVLNQYELISLSIQRGILDYKLYRLLSRSVTLRYWEHGYPFIATLRGRLKNDMFYHEFEEMVKWLKDEKKPKRHWWWGKLF